MQNSNQAPPAIKPGSVTSFVGRRKESRDIRSAFEQAISGRGSIHLISGEPGIGKTRLADELAREAAGLEMRIAWGWCWESEDAPPYWPWIQILRSVIRGCDPSVIASQMGGGAEIIASLVPESRDAAIPSDSSRDAISADSSEPSAGSHMPEMERFRLFDSISSFLQSFANDNLLLLIFDDIHSADVDSLLLLRFLARDLRRTRITILGTYRDSEVRLDPRRSELISDIEREGQRVHLIGFDEADTAEFVERAMNAHPDPKMVTSLYQTTEGNPLFLNETMRLLISEGRLRDRLSPLTSNYEVPDGIRATIRRRVRLVSESTHELLSRASSIGREFDLPTLRALTDFPNGQVHAALDEAVGAGLLGTVGGPLARYRYSHALIRETLYDELPAGMRRKLHLTIAETLEHLGPDEIKAHPSEIANHFVRALPEGPVDKALEYARSAAQQALAFHAYEDAVRFYRTMLEILPLQSAVDENLRFETTISLGDALNRAGLFNQCRETFELAALASRRAQNPDHLIRAALGRGMPITESGVIDRTLIALLEEALRAAAKDDFGRRAMLMARLGSELYWSDEAERGAELARQAVELARSIDDDHTLIYVLHYAHMSLWSPDNLEQRCATIDELIELALKNNSRHWALRGHYLRFVNLLEMGNLQAAREQLAAYRDLTVQLQQPYGVRELCEASMALVEGHLDDARQLAERALSIGENLEGRTGHFRQTFYVILLTIRWQQGQLHELQPVLRDIVDRSSGAAFRASDSVAARCVLALSYCEAGHREEAALEFERLAAANFAGIPRKMTWLGCMVVLAEICAQLGDAGRAKVLYDLLLPYASRNPLLTWHVCFGSARHYLGRLALTMSRVDEAIDHFEAATRANQLLGAQLWVVTNQYYWAEALMVRNKSGDRDQARSILKLCLHSAAQLGITLVQRKAEPLLGVQTIVEPPVSNAISEAFNEFHREGDFWTVRYEGRVSRIRDIKGMSYIANLLTGSGRDFHVLELTGVGLGSGPGEEQSDRRMSELEREDLHLVFSGDAGEMLDAEAKASYKRRLDELRVEQEEAREFGDADRAAGIQEEIDAVTRELRRAIGLGGRDRRAGSVAERARLNVSRAIKSAIGRIARTDPGLGTLLSKSIKTGLFCSYVPPSNASEPWRV
jgi:tetratricopeptide (TPR) repeat protein